MQSFGGRLGPGPQRLLSSPLQLSPRTRRDTRGRQGRFRGPCPGPAKLAFLPRSIPPPPDPRERVNPFLESPPERTPRLEAHGGEEWDRAGRWGLSPLSLLPTSQRDPRPGRGRSEYVGGPLGLRRGEAGAADPRSPPQSSAAPGARHVPPALRTSATPSGHGAPAGRGGGAGRGGARQAYGAGRGWAGAREGW